MEFKHDLFLCHNKANKDWVRELGEKIESEEYDGRNLKVFFDEWDIKPGKNVVNELEKGLTESRFVGVVLSKAMLEADWPTMEWTIAVCNDPSGRKGTIIPIWLGDCEIPDSLKIRNVLYFRNETEFKKSYPKLVAVLKSTALPRGTKNSSSSQREIIKSSFPIEYQDEINEQLASNLFPVTYFPEKIWSGPIGSLTHKDVFDYLRRNYSGVHPTFLIREKRLYCFWDLNHHNCPFKKILTASNIEKESSKKWISDSVKRNWLIELFNRALKGHCWDLNLIYDRDHGRFFFPPLGGKDRTETWNTGKRKSTRHITTRHTKGKSGQVFWSHQSLRAKFVNIDDEIFLQLTPGWTFTFDGEHPLSGREVGIFSTKWTTKEHNPSVFYHVRFWSNLLSKRSSKISVRLGNEKLEVDTTPAVIEIPIGIEGDFHPIEKVFETADDEIESTENTRDNMLKEDNKDG